MYPGELQGGHTETFPYRSASIFFCTGARWWDCWGKLFKQIGNNNCSTSVHNCAVPHQATPRCSNRDVRSHRQRDPSSSMSRTLPHTAMIPSASIQYWYVQVHQLHYTIDRICPLHRWWPCSHSCLCSKLLEDDDDNNLWRRISRCRQFIEFVMFAIANPIILTFIISLISRLCRDPRLYSDLKLCVCL